MADGETIHKIAEILFKTATENDLNVATAFSFELDPITRIKYSTFTVPVSQLADTLRPKITESAKRNTIAFLDSLGIVCKITDVRDYGRAFYISLPGELAGKSWSRILEEHGHRRPKDDV